MPYETWILIALHFHSFLSVDTHIDIGGGNTGTRGDSRITFNTLIEKHKFNDFEIRIVVIITFNTATKNSRIVHDNITVRK